ncbi:MAG: FHA domain-containing protein, partial [Planctomycetes bacterium]|nr:FHA domain-containing protein [Planctomycetota bacterium]
MAVACIEMVSGPDKGKSYPIDPVAKKFTLGRTENNDVRLEGKTISRHHAQISVRNGDYVITDLGSKNRTKVNGEPITEKVLADGDEIRIGSNVMRFRGTPSARASDEGTDDGTQFVDMGTLLSKKGSPAPARKAALDEVEDEGTEQVNMGALVKSKSGSPAKKVSARRPKDEPDEDERTNIIDQAKFLGKSRSSVAEPKAPGKAKASRPSSPNTPQNVSFARTEEGGNIEEGTDLLNMEEVLGDSAPKVREISPTFLAVAGGGLVVGVLVFMVVWQAVFATSAASQVEKLVVGQNKILHLNARPDNLPTAIPVKADQDLVGVEQFLV